MGPIKALRSLTLHWATVSLGKDWVSAMPKARAVTLKMTSEPEGSTFNSTWKTVRVRVRVMVSGWVRVRSGLRHIEDDLRNRGEHL